MLIRRSKALIISLFYKKAAYLIDSFSAFLNRSSKTKVFCIGLNKTGTTSLEAALRQLDYNLGNQRKGEILIDDWAQKKYKRIIKFCETADAFQDIPFSLSDTYKVLDEHFPNSKFILTIRDDGEKWYKSLVNFHSKLYADGNRIPTTQDLREAFYITKGRPLKTIPLIFNTTKDKPYDKHVLIDFYYSHIENVKDYFGNSPEKLLIINVAQTKDYFRLCDFLETSPVGEGFPWLNKTSKNDTSN